METCHETSKILINGEYAKPSMVFMYGKQIENVDNLKYLEDILSPSEILTKNYQFE